MPPGKKPLPESLLTRAGLAPNESPGLDPNKAHETTLVGLRDYATASAAYVRAATTPTPYDPQTNPGINIKTSDKKNYDLQTLPLYSEGKFDQRGKFIMPPPGVRLTDVVP